MLSPIQVADFSAKPAIALITLMQKQVNRGTLKNTEQKKMDRDFESYMEHHWRDMLGNGGTL